MIFALVRVVRYVVANPNRSVTWKVIDVSILSGLLVMVVLALLSGGVLGLWYYWSLVPIVYLATRRSWYELPARRRARAHPSAVGALSPGRDVPVGASSPRSWDEVAASGLWPSPDGGGAKGSPGPPRPGEPGH